MGGEDFVVQLDSGSSDLWLDTANVDTSKFQNTNVQSSIVYADGTSATGPDLIGDLTFGNFSVSQAFISAPGSNATTNGADRGLMGVGPPLLSVVSHDLLGTQFNGKTVLENIFAANPSEPNFITFQLSRSQTLGTTAGGIFTIGEVDSQFSGVSNQPKLSVVAPNAWIVLMDGIEVDGNTFSGHSNLTAPGQTSTQTLANLDTGTSLGVVPQFYLDAIYKNAPGSAFSDTYGVYILPCDTKIKLSFIFGGQKYPIHPIDTVQATLTPDKTIVCFSGFGANGPDPDEDLLLGDSFLRNVYAVFDFGSFISGTTLPFIQLLSTTDPDTAASEFDQLSAQRNASLNDFVNGGTGSGSVSGAGDVGGSSNGAIQMGISIASVIGAIGLWLGVM